MLASPDLNYCFWPVTRPKKLHGSSAELAPLVIAANVRNVHSCLCQWPKEIGPRFFSAFHHSKATRAGRSDWRHPGTCTYKAVNARRFMGLLRFLTAVCLPCAHLPVILWWSHAPGSRWPHCASQVLTWTEKLWARGAARMTHGCYRSQVGAPAGNTVNPQATLGKKQTNHQKFHIFLLRGHWTREIALQRIHSFSIAF